MSWEGQTPPQKKSLCQLKKHADSLKPGSSIAYQICVNNFKCHQSHRTNITTYNYINILLHVVPRKHEHYATNMVALLLPFGGLQIHIPSI